ncbi:DEAD-box ATP-dependent RNA helicase 22-like [Vicia villosa]|uniref:DEAD-box ATP-dependent RNA helicase 22-like n=1 Tax=Vicia villosa TaxID=3911 RepID=UPI00273B47B1|nr:DEAD-box ATP-dependent RNA helicase 22-like [Vicia villosa]XP_058761468.1 DEAD-box ATP-dependent RNA helicase 22-like [Vicia villosa]XP_058761469.1 DEAD-box ATP-dependent RNA helicase 22-like [Vicia villosa]
MVMKILQRIRRVFSGEIVGNRYSSRTGSHRLKQRWIEVSIDTQVKELIKAVNHGLEHEDFDSDGGIRRTMVFANTVEAAETVAKILNFTGLECLRYHKNCTLEERAHTLVDFHEKFDVLVCTDATAHGVDIPNVLHVIQLVEEHHRFEEHHHSSICCRPPIIPLLCFGGESAANNCQILQSRVNRLQLDKYHIDPDK